jgi:RNA polymerase sigma-70 factor (ECF subfamily)
MESGSQPSAGEAAATARAAEPEPALDRRALEAQLAELLEPVYAFVFWRVAGVAQDAEDVTQDTFATALATVGRFEGRSSLYTWICGIARNLARERVRTRARPPAQAEVDPAAPPDVLLERAQTERLVGLALTELAPHYQAALLDKYVHQRSFAEMAAASQATAKAVESTVQRAKRALGEGLRKLGLGRTDGDADE